MKRRKKTVAVKVKELREMLGGRKAVVHVMRAASSTSLRRWEKRKCAPILAHMALVDDTYKIICRMRRVMVKKPKNKRKRDWKQ